jgi:hypothetical protein
MGQFLKDARRRGKPFWRSFFMGDAMEGASTDATPEFEGTVGHVTMKALRGVTLSRPLLGVCLLGAWLMFTRLIFGTEGAMANSDHLAGAFLITFSVLALADVARPMRFLNIPIGLWLLIAPWVLSGASAGAASVGSVLVGLLVIGLSVPRGPIHHRYAGWNRLIR